MSIKFQILLELIKQGNGATEAKQELEQIKPAADQAKDATAALTSAADAASEALTKQSEATQPTEAATAALTTSAHAASEAITEQAAAAKPAEDSTTALAAASEAVSEALTKQSAAAQPAESSLREISAPAKEAAEAIQTVTTNAQQNALAVEMTVSGAEAAKSAMGELGATAEVTGQKIAQAGEKTAKAEEALKEQTKAAKAGASATKDAGSTTDEATAKVVKHTAAVQKSGAALQEVSQKSKTTKDAVKELSDEADRSSDRLNRLFKEVATAGAAVVGGIAIRSSVMAFIEQDEVTARLVANLKNAGYANRQYIVELQAQSEAVSDLTGVQDEVITGVDAQLVSFGALRDEMPKLRAAILDISAAGYNIESVAEVFGSAINGNFSPASRLLKVEFDENATKAENLARLLQVAETRFGGLAEAVRKTASGELKAAQTAIGDINEEVGKLIVQGLQPAIKFLGGAAIATAKFMAENQLLIQSLLPVAGILVGELVVALTATAIAARVGAGGAQLFGAMWLKSAADARAAAALIATSSVSMGFAIAAAVAVATLGVYTLVKAYQALTAAAAEAESKTALEDLNVRRRQLIEDEITIREKSGKLHPEAAQELRDTLATGFKTSTEIIRPPATSPFGAPNPVQIQTRNVDAEREALSQVARRLEPEVFKPQEPMDVEAMFQQGTQPQYEQLRTLTQQLQLNSLGGLEKERAAIEANYQERQRQIEQLEWELQLGADQVAQLETMNAAVRQEEMAQLAARDAAKAKTEEKQREVESARQVADELQTFEQQLTTVAVGSSESRVERAQREYEARLALYQKLFEAGRINEERLTELTRTAALQRVEVLAAAAEQGKLEAEKLKARQTSLWAEETIEINRQFEVRRQNLLAYYQFEIEQAEGNAQRIAELEGEKTQMLEQLQIQQRRAVSQTWQDMVRVAETTKQNFASGAASLIVNLFDTTKKASDLIRQFFADLARQIAQLILQTLILRALTGAFGGAANSGGSAASGTITGPTGNTLSTGAQFSNVGMSLKPLAEGGVLYHGFNTLRAYAAGGMGAALKSTLPPALMASAMLYAADVKGVQMVDKPTILPEFGALTGEAGDEALTVLAQPKTVNIGGVSAVVGNAGPSRLALLDESVLRMALNQAPYEPQSFRPLASGGILNAPLPSPRSGSNTFPATITQQPNGKVVIEVSLSAGLQAAIVKESVEAAEVRVTEAMGEDGALSRAVKERVS